MIIRGRQRPSVVDGGATHDGPGRRSEVRTSHRVSRLDAAHYRGALGDLVVDGADARIDAVVIRSGTMLRYLDDSNVVDELVTDAAAFGPNALSSIVHVPVYAWRHPTPTERRMGGVGFVESVRRDGTDLVATIVLKNGPTLRAVREKRLTEVSAGYARAARVLFPGRLEQTDRHYDHVALLPPRTSRCGSACSIKSDCADHRIDGARPTSKPLPGLLERFTRGRLP